MTTREKSKERLEPGQLLATAEKSIRPRPIWLVRKGREEKDLALLPEAARAWLTATAFKATPGRAAVVPGPDGAVAGGVLVLGSEQELEAVPLAAGNLPGLLPDGHYSLAGPVRDPLLASVAWALGAYRFARYRSAARPAEPRKGAVLVVPDGVERAEAVRIAEGVWLGRDLINTPASDLGPGELAESAAELAKRHGAKVTVIAGEDLLGQNFPMLHAVGRASTRPPCLIDIRYEPRGLAKDAPRITLIGKGICFDTGGLDIKPASSMLLMKKDMGGAASVLAAGHMLMGAALPIRLRLLMPAAENAIAGNAFRPGDVLKSRSGLSVEIGNTDAEGRLVLADAMALADEERPDLLVTFATLTGAARVALGPELAPLYATDEKLAEAAQTIGIEIGDPCWRMPFWPGYDRLLDSEVADLNNVSEGGMAGSVIAAMFLKRFIKQAKAYLHLDIYGWVPGARPGQPKGGEAHMARTIYRLIRERYGAR